MYTTTTNNNDNDNDNNDNDYSGGMKFIDSNPCGNHPGVVPCRFARIRILYFGSGSGPGRVTRCLGPRADSGRKNTRHNNLVRSLIERAHFVLRIRSNSPGTLHRVI